MVDDMVKGIDVVAEQPPDFSGQSTREAIAARTVEIKANAAAKTAAAKPAAEGPDAPDSKQTNDLDCRLKQAADLVQLSKDNLRHLQTKRVDAERRLHAMSQERKELSYGAHTGNDETARKELDHLNSASISGTLEVENLDSAITQAERLLAKAEKDHALALEHVRAAETLDHISALIEAGAAIDKHLNAALEEFNRLENSALQIFQFCNSPTVQQVRVFSKKALASIFLPKRQVFETELLAPNARTTFSAITQQWANLARSICERKLGVQRSEAAD
jgi:hypothetical protein